MALSNNYITHSLIHSIYVYRYMGIRDLNNAIWNWFRRINVWMQMYFKNITNLYTKINKMIAYNELVTSEI